MDKDYQDYKDFDMSGATRGTPPHIAKLKANSDNAWLDEDLSVWIANQDSTTKRHINEMIRHAMALKLASA